MPNGPDAQQSGIVRRGPERAMRQQDDGKPSGGHRCAGRDATRAQAVAVRGLVRLRRIPDIELNGPRSSRVCDAQRFVASAIARSGVLLRGESVDAATTMSITTRTPCRHHIRHTSAALDGSRGRAVAASLQAGSPSRDPLLKPGPAKPDTIPPDVSLGRRVHPGAARLQARSRQEHPHAGRPPDDRLHDRPGARERRVLRRSSSRPTPKRLPPSPATTGPRCRFCARPPLPATPRPTSSGWRTRSPSSVRPGAPGTPSASCGPRAPSAPPRRLAGGSRASRRRPAPTRCGRWRSARSIRARCG